jgi:DNA end-binding protein Ku
VGGIQSPGDPSGHAITAAGTREGATMPRSMWRGAISFGMVAIPIRLYLTTESKSTVSFHLLCPKDGSRIRNLRWCPKEDREIPWKDVVHGYEVGKDEYVEFTDEDFEKLPLPSTRTLEVVEFCEADQIPDIYVDRSYYIEPEQAGRKPYALLRTALEKSGRVAVGKIALRDREHLARIDPVGDGLVMNTLHWPDEIRDQGSLDLPGKVSLSRTEVDLAMTLVDRLSRRFDPSEFRDEYKKAVEAVVREKTGKRKTTTPKPPEPPRVVDLMEALKASVEAARTGQRTAARTERTARDGRRSPSRRRPASAPRSRSGSTRRTASAASRRKAG